MMVSDHNPEMPNYWNTFSAAPHRMFFFGGIVQSLMALAWWLVDLGGRYGGYYAPVHWTISPVDAHAFLMLYSFFPFFIFGFLMTTYPKWMNGEEVARQHYVPAFLMLSAGTLAFYIGLVAGRFELEVALTLFLAGWGVGLYGLLSVYVEAKHPDKRHAAITTVMLAMGWILVAGFLSGDAGLITLARTGGVWLFLLPIFFAVSHRMIPFFTANAIPGSKTVRPVWALILIPTGSLMHALLGMNGLHAWTWLVDMPMAAGAIYLTWAWGLRASLSIPILGMLHLGFAWLGVAMLLYTIQSLSLLITGMSILAKAPLHAMAIGYFASILLAMATRVTLGHSGRRLVADHATWGIFLAFQSVAVLRIISEFPLVGFAVRSHLYLVAGLLWVVCFGLWAGKYAPIYWKPRLDGQAG